MIDILRNKMGLDVHREHILAPYTTYNIGGPAEYFVEVSDKASLYKAISTALHFKLNYFLLGGGSNILIADEGIRGIVIRLIPGEFMIKDTQITAFAGDDWKSLVRQSVMAGLAGLEPSGNIPGTVGGAIRGNAGAYGVECGNFVTQVEALAIDNNEVQLKILSRDECMFRYRDSIFKDNPDLIVSEATFVLPTATRPIEEALREIDDEYKSRCEKHPMEYPNSGSTFKNVILTEEFDRYKDWAKYGKIPAGKFIEEVGLKGMKIGGAQISEKHANFIINTGTAKADDVIQLISLAKMKVRDAFAVQLQEEVQYVGFDD